MGRLREFEKKFIRTGNTQKQKAAQQSGADIRALNAELLGIARDEYTASKPLMDLRRRGSMQGISNLRDLFSGIDVKRPQIPAPEIFSQDPALIGQAVQAARSQFSGSRRALRRRVGGMSGSGSGGLGMALFGNELQANMASSNAAVNAQNQLQQQTLTQLRANENLRYNFDKAEQDRPFTQRRALSRDLLGMGTGNPSVNNLISAIKGAQSGSQNVANIYANATRKSPFGEIFAPMIGNATKDWRI